MAALNFPASPVGGQIYSANGLSYQWDAVGLTWKSVTDAVALVSANNLSDLADAATARGNIDVYSTDEVDAAIAAVSAGTLADGDYGDVTVSGSGTVMTVDRAPGTLIGVQTITATGAGTYTPTAGTNSIVIEMVGGGASGGGAVASASNLSMAGSGGGGAYLRKRLTANFSGASYSVGAGGAAPTAGNNAGNNGSNTTFTATGGGGTVYTAGGGVAGGAGASGSSTNFQGASAGGAATNGDVNAPGGNSAQGQRLSATLGYSGSGGDSFYGRGGRGANSFVTNTSNPGAAGGGYGGGGSGAVVSGSGAAQAGGVGANGVIIIHEYS